jgi:2-dehydro-3-deoxyphosphogluconate aldolase/(4S)-4-hydroxy-2-oxoglutarate aldolase
VRVLDVLSRVRVVPVVVLDDAGDAPALADALLAGGLPIAEVTFRTPAAVAAIRLMARHDDLVVGAGTVTTAQHVDQARDAGARFVVSPGISRAVVRRCRELDLPVLPGTATATDIMTALDEGVSTVKFFPAGPSGGLGSIDALSGPFPHVRFVPTGGVNPDNAPAYLAHRAVLAVGGTWMVPRSAVTARDTGTVARLCRDAVALAAAGRPDRPHGPGHPEDSDHAERKGRP